MNDRNLDAKTLLTLTLGLTLLFLTGCGRHEEHSSILIGYLPYSSALSFFVAHENGYFAQAGLTVEPVKCASGNEAMDALRAGKLDFIAGVGMTTFFAVEGAAQGSFKCFQPCVEDEMHDVSYLLVPKDSTLSDVVQLKGKKVGTYSGTSQVLVLRLLLRKFGFDPDTDVQLGDVATNLQVDALTAGQFDAFLMLEPYASKAMLLHGAKPLVANPRVRYILDPFPAGTNAVSTRFFTAHPDLTTKVIAALDQAIDAIHNDEAAAKAILPKYDLTLTVELSEKSGIYRWWKKSETNVDAVQKYADLLYEGKAIKNPVNVSSMFIK